MNLQNKWIEWLEYKRVRHRFKFKSEKSEIRAYDKLIELAKGDEQQACKIIENAIQNGWQGLHEIKDNGKAGTSEARLNALKNW